MTRLSVFEASQSERNLRDSLGCTPGARYVHLDVLASLSSYSLLCLSFSGAYDAYAKTFFDLALKMCLCAVNRVDDV